GVLIYDTNGITRKPERKDITVYSIDAVEEAAKLNNPKIFNMVVLGAYLKVKPIIKLENVVKGLEESLPERYHHLIPVNRQALEKGMEIIRKVS
ncbi:MAG: 2-oxoglutarate ferredoxin oxidoreductase subunit gamma, partial [Bacteroidales bacterium]|nr:2-oxoglutarate ferredoxin oxidoreductase subunit gamma [Bacteroidales bacterium]